MGLFSIFNRKKVNASSETNSEKLPDIPREVFIEDYTIGEGAVVNSLMDGITQVYNFLQADYESKGYSDSLVNP
ncbi:MAG: hypothetical protein HC905_07270, partial [Bacteroidales bacterium]|nr:hypothetical protein [Bacteroidales bacterium]